MLKHSYLVFQKIKDLYKNSPLIFTVLVLVQVITVLSFLFFITTIVKSRSDYISNYETMRTIKVDFPMNNYETEKDIVSLLVQNRIISIDNIRFIFVDSSDKNKSIHLMGYLKPELVNGDVFGCPILDKDITNLNYIIIPKNENKNINPAAENYKVGDKIKLAGRDFYVSGVRSSGYMDEIPYTIGINLLHLSSVEIIIPANINDGDKESLKQYIENEIPGCTVSLPKKLAIRVISSLFFPLILSIFIGIIAILNFTFIYMYLIKKCERDYILLRLVGCKRITVILLAYTQLAFLFTISYIIGIILLIFSYQLGLGAVMSASVTFEDCIYVYFCFMIFLMLVILPFSVKFFRSSIITEEKKI